MKVPTIDEMMDTFDTAWGACPSEVPDDCDRAGLLAVFETHVKGMLAEAFAAGDRKIPGYGERPEGYAERILALIAKGDHNE